MLAIKNMSLSCSLGFNVFPWGRISLLTKTKRFFPNRITFNVISVNVITEGK